MMMAGRSEGKKGNGACTRMDDSRDDLYSWLRDVVDGCFWGQEGSIDCSLHLENQDSLIKLVYEEHQDAVA